MKAIKWNWGTGITLVYASFAIFMLTLAFKASSQDFNLVTNNYYEQEVNYQQHIDRVSRSKGLIQKVAITQTDDKVQVQFPYNMTGVSGTILFYRPSDSGKDKEVAVKPGDDNLQTIAVGKLAKGNWKAQINWSAGGIDYYDEHDLKIK